MSAYSGPFQASYPAIIKQPKGRKLGWTGPRGRVVPHHPSTIVPLAAPRAGWLSCIDLDLLAVLLFSIIDLDLKRRETPL
jgi:hypothetical protein